MTFAIIKMALIGFALGIGAAFLYRSLKKQPAKKGISASTGKAGGQTREAAAIEKRLFQLRSQLDNGLLTREEYKAKKQEILKGQ